MTFCANHGTLMRDLAVGRLEDESLDRARETRRSCPTCSAWWRREINDHLDVLDPAVARAFSEFRAPAQRRFAAWQPLAAAAVLALAVGLVLEPTDTAVDSSDRPSVETTLTRESFEIETLEDIDLSGLSMTVVDSDSAPDSIFDATQESGDLADWSSHG